MVGLGCGARSYTRSLHYSPDYAVRPKGVKGIIADYLARTRDELAHAEHGFALDENEQKRRYLLQSILNAEGLDSLRYAERFGTDPADDFPDLHTFAELGLLSFEAGGGTRGEPAGGFTHSIAKWTPTALGLERSDALGPWFFSARVRNLMGGYEAK